MTQKIKVAVESPPRTGTIIIEEDQQDIKILVRDKPEKDAVQWRGQPPPGPGPRKCWACGFKWVLLPGVEDICPRCNHPNVIKEIEMPKVEYVFKERDSSPEEEIQRSRNMLQQLRSPGETELTVGDLSIVKENQRERDFKWSRKPINIESGVTVGDLYEGPKAGDIKPSTSESQEIAGEMIRSWKEKKTRESLEGQLG